MPDVVPICDVLLTGFLPDDKDPYTLTPNAVELILTLGALFPRGGPVQDPVLTPRGLGFRIERPRRGVRRSKRARRRGVIVQPS